ncbi:MAG: hypothetical protein ACE5NN_00130 [Candidatus Bathyarchaeia archaeon]
MSKVKRYDTRFQKEFETLKRLGMRWAVLAALSYELRHKKVAMSHSVTEELRRSRAMIESACFPVCEVNCSLNTVERILIPKTASLGSEYFNYWQELLGRAMSGRLTPQEVRGLPFAEPLIRDCEFLRCICTDGRV